MVVVIVVAVGMLVVLVVIVVVVVVIVVLVVIVVVVVIVVLLEAVSGTIRCSGRLDDGCWYGGWARCSVLSPFIIVKDNK